MAELQTFIQTTRESRELKRALAVQNTLAGRSWPDVAAELGVTTAFIGKWRWRYKREGLACLRLGYQGSSGYLAPAEKTAVLAWIQAQTCWDVRRVQAHIWEQYGVRYKSRQSYYALLKAARQSWKKTQHRHPDADVAKIAAKRAEIKKNTPRSPGHHPEAHRRGAGG